MESAPVVGELDPPNRTLMGPGPSEVHPRVLSAMATPLVGHLDRRFLDLMDEVQALLRYTFRTENEFTIPVSGTGSAAMEAAITSAVAPDDTVLVGANGYFGDRMAEMARRAGGEVERVSAPWGEPLDPADVDRAMRRHEPDIFGFVHAETSTGVLQPNVSALTDIAHEVGALTIVDTVTSLGGVELRVDDWGIDIAYSGSQKCLSCPPGSSPVTIAEAALERIADRAAPPRSWYLDLGLLGEYWGDDRAYHHTAPITNVYGLREALRLVAEEGIERRWERHRVVASALRSGLVELGLEPAVADEHWLPTLTTVEIPPEVDGDGVIERLLHEHGIEIAGGLGELAGEVFRIGCMGHSARPETVLHLLAALGDVLVDEGVDTTAGAGVSMASEVLHQATSVGDLPDQPLPS